MGFLSQIKSSLLLLLQAVARGWWKKSISETAGDSAGAGVKEGEEKLRKQKEKFKYQLKKSWDEAHVH